MAEEVGFPPTLAALPHFTTRGFIFHFRQLVFRRRKMLVEKGGEWW